MLESTAVTLVLILSGMVIYLIVQYNMIDDDDTVDEVVYQVAEVKPVAKKEKMELSEPSDSKEYEPEKL